MEEAQDADIDGIDRESLVKEIELIRQTLGGASTRACTHGEFASYDIRDNERDSDDSEDELAIIKSPEYRENPDETYQTQHVPTEVISSESEDETQESTTKDFIPAINISDDSDFSPDECVSYEISSIVPLNHLEVESEPYFSPVSEKSHSTSENVHTSQAQNSPSIQPLPNLEQSDSFPEEQHSDDYHLTELQPAKNSCQPSEVFQGSLASLDLDHNHGNSLSSLVSPNEAGTLDDAGSAETEIHVLSDEEDSEELNEQQRCLKLNRKYQTIIETQLKKIERLLAENREKQVGLDQTSSSSLTKADEAENRHLSSYANPYFRIARREFPDDNEDAKHRRSVGQPHSFQTPPRPWSKEEKGLLSDAVKSEILKTKQMPLLKRLEVITPKLSKTEEDEKEIEDLRNEIECLKALSIVDLVADFTGDIDFDDVSNKVLSSRTPHQCQVFWYNELHPLLNKGKWEKEEDKLLLRLAEENSCGGNWDKIAIELQSNRSPAQCLHRYQRSLNKNFLKSKWDPEDDKKLVEAVNACGIGPWEKVSSFIDGRTGPQCMHRYIKSLDPEIKKGKWAKEEDDLLRKGVELYGFNWFKFKSLLPRRTDSQIRERWQDVLDPNLRKGAFSKEEDERLLRVVGEQSVGLRNWSTIAKHMPGRTDNKCRRRWFSLMKDDPKTKEHFIKQKITRAKLVNNFSRRRSDKPEIGPEDFDMCDFSETEEIVSPSQPKTKAGDVTSDAEAKTDATFDDVTNLDATSDHCSSIATPDDTTKITKTAKDTKENSTPKSPRETRGKKRKEVSADACTNIQTKSVSTSKTSDVSSSDEPKRKQPRPKTRNKTPTTTSNSNARKESSQSSSKNTPTEPPRNKMIHNWKRTAPNPSVVLQASSLQNGLPISHLTQFSVLLQAFSVDVSGALKNVNTNGGEKASQTSSSSACATRLGQRTPVTVIAQAPSETTVIARANANKQMLNTTDEKVTNNSTDTLRNMRSSVVNEITPTTTVQCATAIAEQGQGSLKGSIEQQTVRSDEDINDGPNTSDSSQSPAANTRSRKVAKEGNDSSEENSPMRRSKRKRDNVVDDEKQKRLNREVAEQEDGMSNASNVLSDSQHGLFSTRPGRACKRKYLGSPSHSRRNRERSNQSNSEGKTPESSVEKNERGSSDDVEVTTSPRRSKRRQREMDARSTPNNATDNIAQPTLAVAETTSATAKPTSAIAVTTSSAEPTSAVTRNTCAAAGPTSAITRTIYATAEPTSSSDRIGNNETVSPGSVSSVSLQNPYLQVRRVIMDTDMQLPRVPSIPPLPPTATTLNAFKTLLTLRKDLQSQTNRLKVAQSDQQPSDQNASDKNPLADRLLLVSDTKEAPHEQFRNSVPYQLLLNRFKGLFMWPGFLSIVNPRFVKPSQSQTHADETNKTSKSKRRKKGRGRQTR